MFKEFEKMIDEINSMQSYTYEDSDNIDEVYVTYEYNWNKEITIKWDEWYRTTEKIKSEALRILIRKQIEYNQYKQRTQVVLWMCATFLIVLAINV